MVYKESFIAVLKCNDKILREQGEYVNLPFGSEYSLLLKNMESRKAQVKIHIDGRDVGGPFVIDPNDNLEIERFVERMDKGNRFKFIQKSQEISDHRGDKIDDGFIRIEFQYEEQPEVIIKKYIVEEPTTIWRSTPYYTTYNNDNVIRGSSATKGINSNPVEMTNCTFSCQVDKADVDFSDANSESWEVQGDEGITVNGSESNQSFQYATVGTLESASHTIILRLRGVHPKTKVKISKPITTKTKITCSTCGKRSLSNVKFCSNCGTSIM